MPPHAGAPCKLQLDCTLGRSPAHSTTKQCRPLRPCPCQLCPTRQPGFLSACRYRPSMAATTLDPSLLPSYQDVATTSLSEKTSKAARPGPSLSH